MAASAVPDDDRHQQISPVAISAVMACRAHEFDRHTCIDRLHDRLVETMEVIGERADRRLLVGVEAGALRLCLFPHSGMYRHRGSPLVSVGMSSLIPPPAGTGPAGTGRFRSIPSWPWSRTGHR